MVQRRRQDMTDSELKEWFYNQKRLTTTGCWEWCLGMNSGYGTLRVNKKPILAHRFSLQLFLNRPIPSNIEVRHMCHNTKCYNPYHLKEGTHADNMADMVNANRQAKGKYLSDKCKPIIRDKIRGEANGKVKLTSEQVIEIRSSNMPYKELSELYSVSCTQIKRIRNRTSWKHLE